MRVETLQKASRCWLLALLYHCLDKRWESRRGSLDASAFIARVDLDEHSYLQLRCRGSESLVELEESRLVVDDDTDRSRLQF